MESNIWENCLDCDSNCCKIKEIAYKLFLTKEEENRLGKGCNFPCKYLGGDCKCSVHSQRPIDCRLWPLDIVKKKDKFYWAYYQTDCPITKKYKRVDLEPILENFENQIIPVFKEYLESYSQHKLIELTSAFGPAVVLREVVIK